MIIKHLKIRRTILLSITNLGCLESLGTLVSKNLVVFDA